MTAEVTTHTSRNGVTVNVGDKVSIIRSDNNFWRSRKDLVGTVFWCEGLRETRIAFGGDASQWSISDNTDIELVEGSGEGVLPVTEYSLAGQLEEALANLEFVEKEVERLQTAYREAYPRIHRVSVDKGEGVPLDMTDPVNWRRGDVFEYTADDCPSYYTKGKEHYLEGQKGDFFVIDDMGDAMRSALGQGRLTFKRRPQ